MGAALRISIPALVLLATACSSEAPEDETGTATDEALSTVISSDYGMTTFGGPGDYQVMACGENSRTSQPWYVASSQRYGCNVHLQLTANGKCLVVQTEDAGPASSVESHAGVPVLDSSPAVAEYFFSTNSLGWSDIRNNPGEYEVHVVTTSSPLGPCSVSTPPTPSPTPPSGDDDDDASAPGNGSGNEGDDSGTSTNPGVSCVADWQCNPGSDGSGMICVNDVCIAGCNASWECPGGTTCQSGACK